MGRHRQTEEFTCHCRIYNNGIPHKVARRTKNQHRQLELRLQLLQQNGQSSASQPALGHDDIPSGPSSWYDENNFEDFDNDIDVTRAWVSENKHEIRMDRDATKDKTMRDATIEYMKNERDPELERLDPEEAIYTDM
jgi:hypothetical protein